MDKEKCLINILEYYEMLESDFNNFMNYIELKPENYYITSNQSIKQLETVGDEFERICKIICGFNLENKKDIIDYSVVVFENIKDISKTKVIVENPSNIVLEPFKGWCEESPYNLFWWKSYVDIKNNRIKNFKQGNLENLLNALAGLYFMDLYLVKKLNTNDYIFEFAYKLSKLFKIDEFDLGYKIVRDDKEIQDDKNKRDFEERFWEIS